jgi:hypothetical protein
MARSTTSLSARKSSGAKARLQPLAETAISTSFRSALISNLAAWSIKPSTATPDGMQT